MYFKNLSLLSVIVCVTNISSINAEPSSSNSVCNLNTNLHVNE